MKHLIAYDLNIPGQNYVKLIQAISSLGSCIKLSESCWVVKTNLTATQIAIYLAACTDSNDPLFICPFQTYTALHYSNDFYNWLNN